MGNTAADGRHDEAAKMLLRSWAVNENKHCAVLEWLTSPWGLEAQIMGRDKPPVTMAAGDAVSAKPSSRGAVAAPLPPSRCQADPQNVGANVATGLAVFDCVCDSDSIPSVDDILRIGKFIRQEDVIGVLKVSFDKPESLGGESLRSALLGAHDVAAGVPSARHEVEFCLNEIRQANVWSGARRWLVRFRQDVAGELAAAPQPSPSNAVRVVWLDKLDFGAILQAFDPLQGAINQYVGWEHDGLTKVRNYLDLVHGLKPLLAILQKEGLFWPGSARPDFWPGERADNAAFKAGQALYEWCRVYEASQGMTVNATNRQTALLPTAVPRWVKQLADAIRLVREAGANEVVQASETEKQRRPKQQCTDTTAEEHAGKATNGYFYINDDYVVFLTSAGWMDYAFGASQLSFFSLLEGKSNCGYAVLVDAICVGDATKYPRYQNAVNKKLQELGATFHFVGSKRTNKVEIRSGKWLSPAKMHHADRKQKR
jgi:hypothetical protein